MMRVVTLLALGLAAPALAQMPGMDMRAAEPTCAKPVIVPGFENWGQGAQAQLGVGRYAELALSPGEGVKFVPPLNRAPEAGSMGGVFALSVKTAGTYRIAMSPGAWIDVIGGGARLPSAAHAHGPDCSGIGKIVDYALPAGDYVVQFSATKAATLKVMVIAVKH